MYNAYFDHPSFCESMRAKQTYMEIRVSISYFYENDPIRRIVLFELLSQKHDNCYKSEFWKNDSHTSWGG